MDQTSVNNLTTLNSAIRNYFVSVAKVATQTNSKSVPRWLHLYKLIRSNRIESCFEDPSLPIEDENLMLCLKMIRQRKNILRLRENQVLENYIQLNRIFSAKNLKPIAFKGFALSLDSSIPHRVRLYEDIDIIIDKLQAKEYLELFFSSGYQTTFNSSKVDPLLVLKNTGSLNLSNLKLSHNIDIHTTPIWPYFPLILGYNDLKKEAREVTPKDNLNILLPSLSHHALILLSEGTKDLWFRTDKLLDFWICYSALKGDELDNFDQLIKKHRLHGFLNLAQSLLTHIFEIKHCDTHTQSMVLPFSKNRIIMQWGQTNRRAAPDEPFRTRAHLSLIESTYPKLFYLASRARLPTQNDLSRIPYLSRIPSIFIILRPARKVFNIAKKFANTLTQKGDRQAT